MIHWSDIEWFETIYSRIMKNIAQCWYKVAIIPTNAHNRRPIARAMCDIYFAAHSVVLYVRSRYVGPRHNGTRLNSVNVKTNLI